jgi:branched-subunit amino acid aminotransferase/4-amino-4-deoxychorismate lyase
MDSNQSRSMVLRSIFAQLLVVRPNHLLFACSKLPATQIPLGTGAYKLGVNYAPGVMPQKAAARQGYAQNLWLHGPEHYLTEAYLFSLVVHAYS